MSVFDGKESKNGDFDLEKVEDPSEVKQRTRIQTILEERKFVNEAMTSVRVEEIDFRRKHPGLSSDKIRKAKKNEWNSTVRTALESYLREVASLFDKNEEGKELWENEKLGEVVIHPPRLEDFGGDSRFTSTPQPLTELKPKTIEIEGLGDILELPSDFTETYAARVGSGRGSGVERITRQEQIPRDVLQKAFNYTNKYLADLGLEAELEIPEHEGEPV